MTKKERLKEILTNQNYEELFSAPGQTHDVIVLAGRIFLRADGTRERGTFGGRDYYSPVRDDGSPPDVPVGGVVRFNGYDGRPTRYFRCRT